MRISDWSSDVCSSDLARWRIGWVAFDRDCRPVIDRGIEPLIIPPPVDDRTATDIAFAASVIVRGSAIWLYYSLAERGPARAALVPYGGKTGRASEMERGRNYVSTAGDTVSSQKKKNN